MLKENKITKQTFVFSKEELNLSDDELNKMKNIINELDYEKGEHGDTYEEVSVAFFRVKKPSNPIIYNQEIFDIINNEKLTSFLKTKLNMNDYYIDRLQVHKYIAGDYNSMHCDSESCIDYKYTLIFHMNDDYEGGEFRVKNDDHTFASYKVKQYSLIATDCRLPHEVAKIITGTRSVIVWFVSEKNLTINSFSEVHKAV